MRHSENRQQSVATAVPDALLLRQVRDGNDDAFGELYQRHANVARAAARSLLSSRSDAEDVVAEAFSRVLSILHRGGGPEEAFRPYLLTCVRHACYDRSQGIARSMPVDPGDIAELAHARQRGEADSPDGSSNADLVARAFAALPERWQLVLWSTEVDGRRPAELSKELGLTPRAVASLVFRAREGLTEAFLAAHLQRASAPACAKVRPRLAAFVRDNVSGREEASIQDHLDQCGDCQALVDELRQLNRPLRGLLVPAVVGISARAYLARAGGGALSRLRPLLQTQPVLIGAATVGVAVMAGATFSGVIPLRPTDQAPVETVHATVVVPNGSSASTPGGAATGTSGPGSPGPGSPPDGTTPALASPPSPPPPPDGTVPGSGADPALPGDDPSAPPAITTPTLPPVTPALPAVSLPPISLPPISLPPITVPPISLPPITVPVVGLPPITVPVVTLPPITVPVVTVPPITVPPITTPTLPT